jgi:hypothetical protein
MYRFHFIVINKKKQTNKQQGRKKTTANGYTAWKPDAALPQHIAQQQHRAIASNTPSAPTSGATTISGIASL